MGRRRWCMQQKQLADDRWRRGQKMLHCWTAMSGISSGDLLQPLTLFCTAPIVSIPFGDFCTMCEIAYLFSYSSLCALPPKAAIIRRNRLFAST
ncbi:hypothetical protein PoB_001803700 [Plakobranchus ocellatus]|uniref:Uncharacterized protein n=1 Tax=Plakobranchus ocellatus TaxID=259542 RepID=A0AAV3Z8G1_9GAST|nr:hypothetical protein PoB_001803700 [Plakobranchus ocellatus]